MRDHAPPRPPPARSPNEQRRGGETTTNGDPGPGAGTPVDSRAKERPVPPIAPQSAGTAAARPGARDRPKDPAGMVGASATERSGEEPAHPGVPLAPPGIIPESDVRAHSPA